MANILQTLSDRVKHWYIPLIIGILFILLGLYVFSVPLATYITLAVFFSVAYLVSGIMDTVFAVQNKDSLPGWGWYLVLGLLTLLIGLYLVANPGISMVVLPFVVGFTMLFRSFHLLGLSFDLKSLQVKDWWQLAILSGLAILLSFLMLANPLFIGISLVTLTGMSILFVGIASIALSFQLKKLNKRLKNLSK